MENDGGERAAGGGREWTEFQRAAIAHGAGELLVSAAAGSGKTAVLAERCARLVCEGREAGVGIENLLVLTFTEAAATEMKGRIGGAIEGKLREMEEGGGSAEEVRWLRRQVRGLDRASISTLHGFCARVLRQHFAAAGIDPAFEVMDGDEARLLREEVAGEVIARWHKRVPGGVREEDFAGFYEAYAQGSDGALVEMVLRLREMLASVAEPGDYVARARRVYGEGVGEVMERWAREIVAQQVRVEGLRARRAAAEVLRRVGPGAMAEGLARAAEMLAWAEGELREKGCAAMGAVREALSYKWPQCKTVKEVADFEGLKKRTWVKVKEGMAGLCGKALAADVGEMGREMGKLGPMLEVLLGLVEDFEVAYTRAKRGDEGEEGGGAARLDFADLERLTQGLLVEDGVGVRAELRGKYVQVLVDEFQDINPLQAAILEALNPAAEDGAGEGGMFVVGDVKQSIYGFRLAEPGLFLERERRALAVVGGGRGHVFLPHNFRSGAGLIAVMNGVFERVMTVEVAGVAYGEGHRLMAGKPETPNTEHGTGVVELRVVGVRDEDEDEDKDEEGGAENLSAVEREARMVARRVEELMAEGRRVRGRDGGWRAMGYRDVAILLRTMRNKGMIFARALAKRGIPAHAELSTGYFDAPEVRDVLALLEVIDNPRQDIPLATVLVGPLGGFSHDDLAVVRLAFDRERVGFAEAVARFAEMQNAKGKTQNVEGGELAGRLVLFWEKIGRWREMLRTRAVHEGLAEIYGESKILAYVAGLEAGAQRVANLEALHQRALAFGNFRRQGLHRFLRFIERLREAEGDFGEAPVLSEASDVVRIMSVHRSKGLEFPVVIVAGLGGPLRMEGGGARGVRGGGNAVSVHRDLGVGLAVVDVGRNIYYPSAAAACIREAAKRAAVAEEIRLLYVAMTRARDHLMLTGHVRDEAELRTLAERGAACDGALGEDVLVGARRGVEWVIGALGGEGLKVRWPWEGEKDAQVEVVLEGGGREGANAETGERDALVERVVKGEALGARGGEAELAGLERRVTGAYGHDAMTRRAAVVAVTALARDEEEEGGGAAVAAWAPSVEGGRAGLGGEEARLRGTATHRVLEKLDFTEVDRGALVAEAIEGLAARGIITAEEAKAADGAGIAWFLGTEVGQRVITAAKRVKALDRSVKLRREISFAWAGGDDTAASAGDLQTVRGVIDVLIAEPGKARAEIVDYKTDSAWTWQGNVEGHRRQMGIYLRAASEILGFVVEKATLVFLGAREVVEVRADEPAAQG